MLKGGFTYHSSVMVTGLLVDTGIFLIKTCIYVELIKLHFPDDFKGRRKCLSEGHN